MRAPLVRSLRARVTLGFAAVTAALVLVAVVALASLTRLSHEIETILRENYRSVIACADMKEALERQDSAAQFASTGHDGVVGATLSAHRAAFTRALAFEASNITVPGERERVRQIDALYREYTAATDRVLALPLGPERGEAYFRELLPRFTRLKDAVQAVMRMNQGSMEAADRAAKSAARRGVMVTLAVGALALLVALGFIWRLPRTVADPVQTLADAARSVGAGDLDVAIDDPGLRELGPLVEAFHRMVEKLRAYRESSLGELLEARDLANATVRCLLDPVVVFAEDGSIVLSNEAAATTFGLVAGQESGDETQGAVAQVFARAREGVRSSGAVVAPRNLTEAVPWRDRLGERFFLVRAAPLRGAADAGRVIVVAQDVTRLRRIDELKSDMVATVSHEFKTPLTSLRMATHLLLEPGTGPLTEGQREVVTMARDETERLRALVDELLDLVRIETEAGALHRVDVDPRRLLQVAAEAHRALAADKGVALAVEEGAAPGVARVDPEKLGIVLANLVSNAVRHTPRGGRVTLGCALDGEALRLRVRDSGDGVEAGDLARLLARNQGARGGIAHSGRRGLGLTIAQEIVLQHGGELTAESAVGTGSTFTVTIPLARPSDPGPAPLRTTSSGRG